MNKQTFTTAPLLLTALTTLAGDLPPAICCGTNPTVRIQTQSDGTPIYTTTPVKKDLSSLAATGSDAVAAKLTIPSSNLTSLSVTFNNRSGELSYDLRSHAECCNDQKKSFVKWQNSKAKLNLGSASVSGTYEPPSSDWLKLAYTGKVNATSSTGEIGGLFYQTVCNNTGGTGTTAAGNVVKIPVSISIEAGVNCKANLRLVGVTIAGATASASAELKASAEAPYLVSIPISSEPSISYQGPVENTSVVLTVKGTLQTEVLDEFVDVRQINESFKLI